MAIFLLTCINCEDTIAPEPEQLEQEALKDVLPQVKVMPYENVPQSFNNLKGHFKLSSHLEGDAEFSKNGSSKNNIIIHTDVIKEVTLGEYKSYTMRITLPKAPSNKLFNVTIEEKNGEEGLFLTTYTLNNVTARGGGGGAEVGTARTQRYEGFETIPPDGGGGTEENWGNGTGGGATGTLAEYSEAYPYGCEGDILMKDERVETKCTCDGRHTLAEIFDCICISWGGNPPMVEYVTKYLCVPYTDGGNPDANTSTTPPATGAGNGSSGSGDNDTPSIAVIVDDETPCDPSPEGDLNGDCIIDVFEDCIFQGYGRNICSEFTLVKEKFPRAKLERYVQLTDLIANYEFALLEIDCNQIRNWQNLAQHTAPAVVIDKINSLPSSITNDFEIQSLAEADGTVVNLDYFSIKINELPNKPDTNPTKKFTANEFLDYMRRNFNDFVEGSKFEPYCKISSMCQTETALWNSTDPLGSIIYIDIPGDDGVVVCTEFTDGYWYFMTMNAPYAGNHPVSGTRQFGYESNSDGSYNFYVRGVDRIDSNIIENTLYMLTIGKPLYGADDLWESFQNKTKDFVNGHGGISMIETPIKNRPDWDEVEMVLNGKKPISDLGCN